MLEKLLHEIKSGKTHSIDELAYKLNTTPAMIQAMLSHLVELKMISQYHSRGDSCSACSANHLCHQDSQECAPGLYFFETGIQDH